MGLSLPPESGSAGVYDQAPHDGIWGSASHEASAGNVPPKTGGQNRCTLCPTVTHKLKRHMFTDHLPWYFAASTACWKCRVQMGIASGLKSAHGACFHEGEATMSSGDRKLWVDLMNGVLWFSCHHLKLHDPEHLLGFVKQRGLHPATRVNDTIPDFNENKVGLVWEFERINRLHISSSYGVSPPLSVATLLQWMVITNLVAELFPIPQTRLLTL